MPRYYQKSLLFTVGTEVLQTCNGSDPLDTDSLKEIISELDRHILG